MPIDNIDDLLTGIKTPQHPETPESSDSNDYDDSPDLESSPELESEPEPTPDEIKSDIEATEKPTDSEDDYGNKKQVENEAIRERLARQAESMQRKHQAEIDALRAQLAAKGASNEVQQAAQEFEYDPNAAGDWQQQLATFVKQTVKAMGQEEQTIKRQEKEVALQRQFETKFHQGMSHFPDFVDVVGAAPITDAMTVATRGMEDPASFLYAAAKRQPQELSRIAQIDDPYTQMVEMGKLEQRMRKNKVTTNAPKPLGRTKEDGQMPHIPEKKELTIEQQIAQAEAKKRAQLKARQR